MKKSVCENFFNIDGKRCTYTFGMATCRLMKCQDIYSVKNQAECDNKIKGCLFREHYDVWEPCLSPNSDCSYEALAADDAGK